MKSFKKISLLLTILFTLCSCVNNNIPSSSIPPSSNSELSSQSNIASENSSEDTSSQSSVLEKEEIYTKEFFENVVIIFGADKDKETGTLKTSVLSLFYDYEGFNSPSELEPNDFFSWAINFDWRSEWGVTGEESEFQHPDYPDHGIFFPASRYIPLVQKYFDVSEEYIKQAYAYVEEYDGFWLDGGVGIGERPEIEITATEETKDGFVINITSKPESDEGFGGGEDYGDRKLYIAVNKENLSEDFKYKKFEIINLT